MEVLDYKLSTVEKALKEAGGHIRYKTDDDMNWMLFIKFHGRVGYASHLANNPEKDLLGGILFSQCREVEAIALPRTEEFKEFQIFLGLKHANDDTEETFSFGSGVPKDCFAFFVIQEPGIKKSIVLSILEEGFHGSTYNFCRVYEEASYEQFRFLTKALLNAYGSDCVEIEKNARILLD